MKTNGTTSQIPYKVVVAIDFSTAAQDALSRAMALANAHPRGEVHAVTVLEAHPMRHGHENAKNGLERLATMAREAAEELARVGGPVHVDKVVTHQLTGEADKEIVWLAANLDADLVVLGTHDRHGIGRVVLGSVAEYVLRNAGCPVLVVRPKAHPRELREPVIEPPCEACVARSVATKGAERWCATHAEHHASSHVYSWSGAGDAGFRPWGFAS
jgi:nucleotide-binding universal stress UspA family protein